MAREINIGRHTLRFVFDRDAYAGTFRPELLIFLKGPNGSPAGIGPKGWPQWLADMFRPYYNQKGRWSNSLHVRIPHVSWRFAYKYRRFGGMALYRLQSRFYYR